MARRARKPKDVNTLLWNRLHNELYTVVSGLRLFYHERGGCFRVSYEGDLKNLKLASAKIQSLVESIERARHRRRVEEATKLAYQQALGWNKDD